METIWQHKTNRGRVIYDRKPHTWTEKDVERIVKAFAEDKQSDVPMMSEIADRVLYWIAEKLSLDDVAGAAAKVVVRLFNLVRGFRDPPARATYEITPEEEQLLAWMGHQAAGVAQLPKRTQDLMRLREELSSMIEYIDQEVGNE